MYTSATPPPPGYTYTYCYRTSYPAGVTLTAGLAVYVRKGCFIMRAERSRHISPVYIPLARAGMRYSFATEGTTESFVEKTRRGRYLVCQLP